MHPHLTTTPSFAENRVYRHRCVETWAITVPWIGFPLRKLLSMVQPLPNATFVRFESDAGAYFPNVASLPYGLFSNAPWPYVEGLTVAEAWNDLAFMSIGQFNDTLSTQSGSPIRLTVIESFWFAFRLSAFFGAPSAHSDDDHDALILQFALSLLPSKLSCLGSTVSSRQKPSGRSR